MLAGAAAAWGAGGMDNPTLPPVHQRTRRFGDGEGRGCTMPPPRGSRGPCWGAARDEGCRAIARGWKLGPGLRREGGSLSRGGLAGNGSSTPPAFPVGAALRSCHTRIMQTPSPAPSTRELTFRGIVLGGVITLLFTAANVYLAEGRADLRDVDPGRGDLDGDPAVSARVRRSWRAISSRRSPLRRGRWRRSSSCCRGW